MTHVTGILHCSYTHILMFRIAINKLFEWLFSRVLASHCGGQVRFLARTCQFLDLYTVTKSYSFLEGHCKFPAQSLKTFVSDTGKIYTLSKAFFLHLLSGKLFHSGECAFFHL
jgi:hypothetical protein